MTTYCGKKVKLNDPKLLETGISSFHHRYVADMDFAIHGWHGAFLVVWACLLRSMQGSCSRKMTRDDISNKYPFLEQREDYMPICRVRVAAVDCLGGVINYQVEVLPKGKLAWLDWNWKIVGRFSNEKEAREEANLRLQNKQFYCKTYLTNEVKL